MDHQKTVTSITNHPAYLFVGQSETALDHAVTLLQNQFCFSAVADKGGCHVCFACQKVQAQQHESVMWICPEKQYTIQDLEVISSTIAFALEPGKHTFFVLQKADQLSAACSNALLKSLEEPPAGYHFILLATRLSSMLPTILSRCLIEQLHADAPHPSATLLSFFATTTFHDPAAFAKELDNANPSEWESMALLDQLFEQWAHSYRKALIADNQLAIKQALRVLGHLKKALGQPPMPGSSKLFWKNLFLQIKEL